MAISVLKGDTVEARLWIPVEEVESEALTQLRNIASLPWVAHVAVMPDVHFGKGATVGSVIGMRGAVSPAAVGVDIGCGMGAIRTNLTADDLPESLATLRSKIEAVVPVGFNSHENRTWKHGSLIDRKMKGLFDQYGGLDERVEDLEGRARKQLGTLGGGNHFIELCLDTPPAGESGICFNYEGSCPEHCADCRGTGRIQPRVWMVLHSGSRNIGKSLAEIHIEEAKRLGHNQALKDRDLAVFLAGTPEMIAYRRDLYWAQEYAFVNRQAMFELYKDVMFDQFGPKDLIFDEPILCHHNYVSEETHFGEQLFVTRKGAISAAAGVRGVIPGSMGTRSYIVTGLGNADSLTSASHGAGRKMSRGKAKKNFTLEDLATQTAGVECRKDQGVLDEIPSAYKDIEKVMEYQKDLVRIDHELKAVLCVKG